MAFTDDFTEASNTNLEDHTPSGGTAWTLVSGNAGSMIVSATTDAARVRDTADAVYTCDDQGSANQYAQARLKTLVSTFPNSFMCCRLVDASNFIGWRLFGTGAAGSRLSTNVASTITDEDTAQGVDESVYRLEVDGTTLTVLEDGAAHLLKTGITSHQTETSQGFRSSDSSTSDWLDDFEAGTIGGGGGSGRLMGSIAGTGGLAGIGGIAGARGGIAG